MMEGNVGSHSEANNVELSMTSNSCNREVREIMLAHASFAFQSSLIIDFPFCRLKKSHYRKKKRIAEDCVTLKSMHSYSSTLNLKSQLTKFDLS